MLIWYNSDINLIEKYVSAAYDPHHNRFHMNDFNRLLLLLFTNSSDNKLRKLPPTGEILLLYILCLTYTASSIIHSYLDFFLKRFPLYHEHCQTSWWNVFVKVATYRTFKPSLKKKKKKVQSEKNSNICF